MKMQTSKKFKQCIKSLFNFIFASSFRANKKVKIDDFNVSESGFKKLKNEKKENKSPT
jgi:hypothetical protein